MRTEPAASTPTKGKQQKVKEGESTQGEKHAKAARKSAKSSGESKAEKITIKREKKVYELPGQTRDTPDEVCHCSQQSQQSTDNTCCEFDIEMQDLGKHELLEDSIIDAFKI